MRRRRSLARIRSRRRRRQARSFSRCRSTTGTSRPVARSCRVADALAAARNPALVLGAGVARSQGYVDAVALAERLRCAVLGAPFVEAAVFPEEHALFQGVLPPAIGPLCKMLAPYDLVVVIGAPVFRYYPYIPGDYLPEGCKLMLVTDDAAEAARAPVGDSILADPGAALRVLATLAVAPQRLAPSPRAAPPTPEPGDRMTPEQLFHALAAARPKHAIVVNETPSNIVALKAYWPVREADSYFFPSSGGLGYGLPAAVGIALAERQLGRHRPVLAFIGDGSLQYSIQALWTAAHLRLPIVVVVPDNSEYAILKAFALLEDTPQVPGLDLPGLDIVSIARGYGCAAVRVETPHDACDALREALGRDGPSVIVAGIFTAAKPLM
jgi:benzoylformate decarboxylase